MIIKSKYWKNVFLFSLGLSLGSAICMKLLEGRFEAGGSPFTIIGLEISYPLSKVISTLQSIDPHVSSLLRFQLIFDFAFMAGIYPAIGSLCMLASAKRSGNARTLLVALAALQLLAWACDIYENTCLLKWMDSPVISTSSFQLYNVIVSLKWLIALAGLLVGLIMVLRKPKQNGAQPA